MSDTPFLARVPLFAQLSPAELAGLAALLQPRRYAKGRAIFHEGDPGTALYIVEAGQVAISLTSAEGKEVILALLGPGEVFGELALLDGEPRSADAVTREASRLLVLPREEFLSFISAHPPTALALLAALSRLVRRLTQVVHDAAFLDVRARLVRTLLELAEAQGRPGPDGVAISTPLTQGELAALMGVTRESVNKWLRYYGRQGLVRHEHGRLTLPDPARLRQDLE